LRKQKFAVDIGLPSQGEFAIRCRPDIAIDIERLET
jgi:hypothetical protein